MNLNDPNFDKELYREKLRCFIMKEAERETGIPVDEIVVYLSKFEPERLKEGEFPTATITIETLPDHGMNTSTSENGKSASE